LTKKYTGEKVELKCAAEIHGKEVAAKKKFQLCVFDV
jgi:hypothetical protein